MFLYVPMIEAYRTFELGTYTVYGVRVIKVTADSFEQIESLPDVFLSEHQAYVFSLQCTMLQVQPVHIKDVVEDFLQQ